MSASPAEYQPPGSSNSSQIPLDPNLSISATSIARQNSLDEGDEDDGSGGKKKKNGKRRKVNHACVYCRRSHMTCDDSRPCKRWCVSPSPSNPLRGKLRLTPLFYCSVKRDIGHLCHDERKPPGSGAAAESGHSGDQSMDTSFVSNTDISKSLQRKCTTRILSTELSADRSARKFRTWC